MPLDQDRVDDSLEKDMSFLDHLEELRWHIIRSLAAVVIFMVVAFLNAPWIFENIIFAPARPEFATFKWLCQGGQFFGGDPFQNTEPPDDGSVFNASCRFVHNRSDPGVSLRSF
jgi:sec-independent protein translocase protein TatC